MALPDSTYLVKLVLKVLIFFIILMFLVILVILVWKVISAKDNRELTAALMAERATSPGGNSTEVRSGQPKNQACLEA